MAVDRIRLKTRDLNSSPQLEQIPQDVTVFKFLDAVRDYFLEVEL